MFSGKRLSFAAAFILLGSVLGFSQVNPSTATVVTSCGGLNLTAGTVQGQYMDHTGSVCSSATLSGSISGNAAASATGAAVPASAGYTGVNVGGNLVGVTGTGTSMNVNCTGGCGGGGGLSVTDGASFTATVSSFTPGGGFFQTTATNNPLTTGQSGMYQMTANRAIFTNLRDTSGAAFGTAGNPLRFDPTGSTTQPVSGTVAVSTINGTAASFTGTSLNVNITGGAGSGGTALTDNGTFTASTTSATPISGFYEASPSTCTTGKACAIGLTTNREAKTVVDNLSVDAAIGSALTSNPVPSGCHNETSPTTIANSQAGVLECDTSQRLITVGSGTAGTPIGGILTVQGVNGMKELLISGLGTAGTPGGGVVSIQGVSNADPVLTWQTDSTWTRHLTIDPCQDDALTKTPFNVPVSASSITSLIAAQSAKVTYICDLKVLAGNTAEIYNIIEAAHTTTACDGSATAIEGSTTAASGIPVAANGGNVIGTGGFAIRKTSAVSHEICAHNNGTNLVYFIGNWVAR